MTSVCVFGEPLLELSSPSGGQALGATKLGVAGDTLNTSVYLARLGHDVTYVTALGTDEYSDAIVERLQEEGVSTEHILRHPTRNPGLYAIRTDARGERRFTVWRSQSAVRDYFSLPDADANLRSALDCTLFYMTGISLSIFPPEQRRSLIELARDCDRRGVHVAFDGNYRPGGWESVEVARENFEAFGRAATLVLPTGEDDDRLFGEGPPREHADRWRNLGAEVVAVKSGADGAWVFAADQIAQVIPDRVINPVDTTGAGDSFNAGFMAAWLNGKSPIESARLGNALAACVIQRRGALIPRSDMPASSDAPSTGG